MTKENHRKCIWRLSVCFRKNRSTSDQIFIVRQMMEKHYEHQVYQVIHKDSKSEF